MITNILSTRINGFLNQTLKNLSFNVMLIERKTRLANNERLNPFEKATQLTRFERQIDTNFNTLITAVKGKRLAIAREYQRLKAEGANRATLREVYLLSAKLRNASREIETKRTLSLAPATPKTNPLKASMPLVPQHKVIVDKQTLESFVRKSIASGWNAAEKEMKLYAEQNKLPLTGIKAQVNDELLKRKHIAVFGEEPKDQSHYTPMPPRMR